MGAISNPAEIAEVYIDESSQNNHRYLVLGGVIVKEKDSEKLANLIMAARMPDLPRNEAKWTKVSRTKLEAYRRVVNVFFENKDLVHFHSLFIDTTKLNHHKYNQGDKEIGFNKEIYQLARKISRLYRNEVFHLYPDFRNTSQKPDELRLILNRGCRKDGDKRDWPFRRCQFRDSSSAPALQLTDIFIGAIAYILNGHDKQPSASPAKIELSQHILSRAAVADVLRGTARATPFSIWPRQLR